MRVAIVATSFPRSDDDPSGHFVLASARTLAASGHEVHVVAPGGSPFDRPFERWGLTIHPAGGGALFGWPGALERMRCAPWRSVVVPGFAVAATTRLARLGHVDRVHAHWIVPSVWPIVALANAAPRACSTEIVAIAHGADVRLLLALPSALRERFVAHVLERVERIEVAAARLRDDLASALPARLASALARRCVVRLPPIEVPDVLHRAVALRASMPLAAQTVLLSVACRLVESKRVDLAIDAAGALEQRGRRAAVVIVGDGPARGRLERHASAAGADVRFVGAVGRTEALAWIAASDALIHASRAEAAPSAVREARALGVPVVATAAGDLAEWARSDRGITIADASPRALADAIASTLLAA